MGYNDEHAHVEGQRWLAFDIETAAREDAAHFVPVPQPDPVNRTLKDPAKIEADIEKKRTEAAEKYAASLAKLSLDVNGCRIVALGLERQDHAPEVYTELSEREMLEQFLAEAEGHKLIGFYSRQFDLPVILQRSRYLGLPIPNWRDWLAPYGRARGHVDLFDELTFDNGRADGQVPRNLSTFCKQFSLDVPQDDVTGENITALIAAGDWAAVREHCRVDVVKTVALARRLGVVATADPFARMAL